MKAASAVLSVSLVSLILGFLGLAAPARADDAQRLADINADLTAGKYEKAAEEAKAFIGETNDKDAVLEARRVLAECLRKQGDWRSASGAYTALSRACPEGSEDRLRYQAIGEVLRATNSAGVYGPALAQGEKRNLSNDEALNDALAMWAELQCKRFKSITARVARARSPADVLKLIKPAAEEARGMFAVAPDTKRGEAAQKAIQEQTRQMALTASAKLNQLCKAARSVLERKLHKYQPKMKTPWAFTNIEERDIEQTNKLCNQMAAAEQVFLETMADLAGAGEWPQAESIRGACTDRQATYRELASQFVVPEYTVEFIW
jgi:hypothetical protein